MVNLKRILIGLIIILLVNPISFAQIIWAEGVLVDESFIEIENSEDLANIKDDLTEDYILTQDIDLKDTEWDPIDEGEFTGTLTGDDFVIQNMPAQYSEDEKFGLFTKVANPDNINVEIEFAAKKIENSDELANMKEDLTRDYILTKDIDLKDAEWEPIQGKFTGTLLGNDFIIENMPAQYLEDENFGLFTEVEDLNNIDIEIEFAEEETEEPQVEEEAVEAKTDEKNSDAIEHQEENAEKEEPEVEEENAKKEEEPVEKSFIEIDNSDELTNIKEDLAGDYILTQDIDLKDVEWEPIEGEFTGTLTGDDFIILNMSVQYLEDEKLGLFTEVEDIKNIDVEVKFAEEEPRAVEEIEEAEEEVVEEEPAEEEEAEEPEIKEEIKRKRASMIEPKSVSVSNWIDLKKRLDDKSVTEIKLMNDIDRSSDLYNGQASVKARELIIDGGEEEYKLSNSRISQSAMMVMSGKGGNITFKNMKIELGYKPLFLVAPVLIEGDGEEFTVTFENINKPTSKDDKGNDIDIVSKGGLVNAKNANVVFKGVNKYVTDGTPTIVNNAKSFTVQESAGKSLTTEEESTEKSINLDLKGPPKVIGTEFITEGKLYASDNKAKMHVKESGTMALYGGYGNSSAIELYNGSEILVEGRFMLGSERETTGRENGLIKLLGDDARFNVDDGFLGFSQTAGSILYMSSNGGEVNISGPETTAQFSLRGGGGNHDAAIHFNQNDGYQLNVTNGAKFEVTKESGRSMGIRVGTGKFHQVNVSGGARFSIHNKGSGEPLDPSGELARNQALYFNGELPQFNLEGDGSEVELIADNGAAMHMTGGGIINALKDTSFIVRGQTASETQGVIDTGGTKDLAESRFNLTSPKYYDFRNDHPDGGRIFTVGKFAEMHGNQTNVSLWKKGSNLDEQPNFRIPIIDYILSKSDFGKIEADEGGSIPDVAEEGVKAYSRMSGNKATIDEVTVNDLYQPTDADKKIYAQVSVPEGKFGTRDLYEGEAEVEITHKKGDGTAEQILTGIIQPRTQSLEESSFEIYSKETKIDKNKGMNGFGWAEIGLLKNDAYLEAGDTIQVSKVTLLDSIGDPIESKSFPLDDNVLTHKRTVVDVTPPEPTELEDVTLTDRGFLKNRPQTLVGSLPTENKEEQLKVSVEVRDKDGILKPRREDELVIDRRKDKFEYTFKEKLVEDDTVQVFLKDNAIPATVEQLGEPGNDEHLDRPDRPETHTANGNINPATGTIFETEIEPVEYHDKKFKVAPTVSVGPAPGELIFESAPEKLNFEVKVKSTVAEYLVDMEKFKLEDDLKIIDDRESKSRWTLNAKMSQNKFKDTKDGKNISTDKLSLIYYDGSSLEGKELSEKDNQVIFDSGENDKKDKYNLSEDWVQDKKGIFIEVKPGILRSDDYHNEVIWTLHDTP